MTHIDGMTTIVFHQNLLQIPRPIRYQLNRTLRNLMILYEVFVIQRNLANFSYTKAK